MKLFLDLDGVLADFDRGVEAVTGKRPDQQHIRQMWKALAKEPDFYGTLDMMHDAQVLWEFCGPYCPTILTGLPTGSWAAPQKVEWATDHFPGVPIITCMAADKHLHMHPGDVLVDDREKHRAAYEEAGVLFIRHTSAGDSLTQLAKIFPSVKAPESA